MATRTKLLSVNLGADYSGLGSSGTAELGYTVYSYDGSTVLKARSTTGITEYGSGYYEVSVANWDTSWSGSVRWDAPLGTVLAGSTFDPGWTADELTALKAILGVPSSGTTPDAPSVGVLAVIRDRIGAFTGTGVNTVLGFFKAMFRSDASTPSDIGGGYSPTTMSMESEYDTNFAIRAASGIVTVTLDDNNDFTTVTEANQMGFMSTNGGTLKFTDYTDTTHTMTIAANYVYKVKVKRFYETGSASGIVIKVFEV